MKFRRRRRRSDWRRSSEKVVAELSSFLTEHLDHPERATAIPSIPAGSGEFPKSLAAAFWRRTLFE